jgi:hypothetical protein
VVLIKLKQVLEVKSIVKTLKRIHEGHGGEASAQYDGESAGRLGSMGESESD